METETLMDEAMRERVSLLHLAQNVLADTIWVDLAWKVMPQLQEKDIDHWSLEEIRTLLPLLDTEASRITREAFPEEELSSYDLTQIFRARLAILQSLLAESPRTTTTWQFAGIFSALRQKLNHHLTTLQATRDIASHFAGLATAAALAHNDINHPPPDDVAWGDTEELRVLRETIRTTATKVQEEVLMGN